MTLTSSATNKQVVLASRPVTNATLDNFRIEDIAVPEPADGQVLLRTLYLSVDPYLLRVIKGVQTYAPINPGDALFGRAICEVVASRHPGFVPGDTVFLYARWQNYHTADGDSLKKVDTSLIPASAYLSVMGHSALTAWGGLLDVGRPKAGETVVVSAAAGAVGSVAGQIARIKGCRAVGIAGGQAKCDHVVNFLGFHACVDYRSPSFAADLRAAVPGGIDVYFENVGGVVFDTVLSMLNHGARVPLCGLVSHYNEDEPITLRHWGQMLTQLVRIQAFRVSDYLPQMDEAMADMKRWYLEGRLKYHESVTQGIENAPAAFVDMLTGRNLGKQLVRLA
ncbi:MAG: NADP-dependent oxidoreductase [Burkholderiaceae bacterium]|nr:NADP-dependent oxidoreductase [Burkholderiaceae bacterium]